MSIYNPMPLSKIARLSWANVLALSAAISSAPVNAQETAEAQIRATVSHYASGLRDADLASLKRAFAENGQFVRVSKTGDVDARPFGQVLASWVESPDPKVAIEITNIRLLRRQWRPSPQKSSPARIAMTISYCWCGFQADGKSSPRQRLTIQTARDGLPNREGAHLTIALR